MSLSVIRKKIESIQTTIKALDIQYNQIKIKELSLLKKISLMEKNIHNIKSNIQKEKAKCKNDFYMNICLYDYVNKLNYDIDRIYQHMLKVQKDIDELNKQYLSIQKKKNACEKLLYSLIKNKKQLKEQILYKSLNKTISIQYFKNNINI